MLPELTTATTPGHRASGRADPRCKLLAALCLIVTVVLTPPAGWPVYVVALALVMVAQHVSGQPWRRLVVRVVLFLPFVVLLSIGVPLSRGLTEGWALMGAVLAKALVSFSALHVLAATTPLPQLLEALSRLKTPRLLVAVFALMIRYLSVLIEELTRMHRAKLSRTFHRSRRTEWTVLGNFVGILFLRSLSRAERVHQAMLARGWRGEYHSLTND